MFEFIQNDLTYAIIPARSGSTSVPHKNICPLAGHPMMAYSIAAAKLTPGIARVLVSTDSEQYAEIARDYGADVPFLRPAEISGGSATDLEFMDHAIRWLSDRERILPEYWVHLRPTTPQRNPEVIQAALERMKADQTADSLRSMHLTELCPFKWFWKSPDGYCQTFNGITLDEANGPRQSFPSVFVPDGYVDILKTSCIVEKHLIHGQKMIAFEVPTVVDVDTLADLSQLKENLSGVDISIVEYLNSLAGTKS